jgi:hypothetical protein
MHTGLTVRPLSSANGWESGAVPHHSWQLWVRSVVSCNVRSHYV